ncbi:MAG: prolyl oligopeptidase family serine peptidase [Caulobacteraceae bacterium]|nr:prolyl oligopeptidase family serine peptidase [Caulobacteraceae bacterium]
MTVTIPTRTALRLLLVAAAAATAAPAAHAAPSPPAAIAFAAEPAIKDVGISPDGAHIVAVTSPDGKTPYISVWKTSNPIAPPTNLGAAHMRIMGVQFIKNDRLLVTARQTFDYGHFKGHLFKLYITDLEGKSWTPALPEVNVGSEDEKVAAATSNPRIISTLPRDPNHILVQDQRWTGSGDIFKVDVYSGAAERVERGSDKYGSPIADLSGEIRAREELNYDNGKVYIAQWIRNPDTKAWEEHFRSYAKDRSITQVAAFTTDPNIVYLKMSKDRDKQALVEYDIKQRKILEPVFETKLFDAEGAILSRAAADYGRPLGFVYNAEAPKVYWTDEKLSAISSGLAKALGVKTVSLSWTDTGGGPGAKISVPDGFDVHIDDFSYDLKYVIVEKSGPNQPPEYYLLTDGAKLTLLGKSRPQIDPASLGDSRLVEYTARDGMTIPAFVHTPPKAAFGPGPYPAIVLPHGGPWARDDLEWDVSGWTKYFTARGFVVIQPQFRGSDGWGAKLWRAGDAQWGLTMQDDNDDAAKWLIAQGLADPKRIALFGYSYGGYAAFAAAVRPNGLYQCVISGAGVSVIKDFEGETYDDRFLREYQSPAIDGLDVIAHAREVSIPIFIYNGDRDQTVPPTDPKKFAAALQSAGKPYKYLEIKDMGHQYVTMNPDMLETQLVEIEKFLHGDCKPGGL